MIHDHGLILNPPADDEYILGGITGVTDKIVLMPAGHGWGAYKPPPELQNRNGLETYNCRVYGTHNALETLAAFHGIKEFPLDCSERYGGTLSPTIEGKGGDPHVYIEALRTEIGVVPETTMPFTDAIRTWADYYAYQTALWLKPFGRRVLSYVKVRHEWVFAFGSYHSPADKAKRLMEALQYGTICVSVYAWQTRKGLYWKPKGQQDNHWVQLLDYEEGDHWLIYDHYDQVEKKLAWSYDFNAAKVYYMERLSPNPLRIFLDRLWALFTRV